MDQTRMKMMIDRLRADVDALKEQGPSSSSVNTEALEEIRAGFSKSIKDVAHVIAEDVVSIKTSLENRQDTTESEVSLFKEKVSGFEAALENLKISVADKVSALEKRVAALEAVKNVKIATDLSDRIKKLEESMATSTDA